MRCRFIAALVFAAAAAVAAPIARAEDAPKDVKGLYLMSDYPAVTLRPGETSTVNLRLHNYDVGAGDGSRCRLPAFPPAGPQR